MLLSAPPVALSGELSERNYQDPAFVLGSLTTITLFHDYLCPWCWVGLFQAKKLTQAFGVEFDWRGAELFPPDMERYSPPPTPAPNAGVTPAAPSPPPAPSRFDLFTQSEGIPMPDGPRPPFTRTHHALLGAEWAHAQGVAAFDVYNEAVYRAFWENRADIADLNVLRQITQSAGLDADALLHSIESGQYKNAIIPFDDTAYALGIRHVPTFLFNAEEKLAEAPYTDLARATERFLIRAEKFKPKM